MATGFGNSKPGLVRGPVQNNVGFARTKTFPFSVRSMQASAEFRIEMFNAFSTPQFGDSTTHQDSPVFGVIHSAAVAARIMQLAVKFSC